MIAKIGKDSQSIKDISKIKAPPYTDGAISLYIIMEYYSHSTRTVKLLLNILTLLSIL
jgi:hypothetical protein